MDEYEEIPSEIETGTVEYWKARARQWQKRCQRAEKEKTELIGLLTVQKRAEYELRERRLAVLRGDSLGGQSDAPHHLRARKGRG